MGDSVYGVIYKITNIINGKIYIGQTKQKPNHRWSNHKSISNNKKRHKNMAITSAIGKYGKENFTFEVIDHAFSYDELNNLEEKYIEKLNTLCPNGYNVLKTVKKNPVDNLNQNKYNIKNHPRSTSKYVGVRKEKTTNKYISIFHFMNNKIYLGRFDTEEDAAKARDIEVLKECYNGIYELNFPELKEQYLNNDIIVLTSQENKKKNKQIEKIKIKESKEIEKRDKKIKKDPPNIYYNSKTNSCSVIIIYNFELHFVGVFENKERGIKEYRSKLKELGLKDDQEPIIYSI
jgi:group I intron endonuclease